MEYHICVRNNSIKLALPFMHLKNRNAFINNKFIQFKKIINIFKIYLYIKKIKILTKLKTTINYNNI